MARLRRLTVVRVLVRYLDRQGGNWATLIAWNLVFAFFPIALLTLAVLGFLLQDPGVTRLFRHEVAGMLPGGQGTSVLAALSAFRNHRGILAVVGVVGLLWSGSSLFGAMDQGLSTLAGCRSRDFLPQKLMAVGMIACFTVLAVPVVLSSSLLAALRSLPGVPPALVGGPLGLAIQIAAAAAVSTLLFFVVYLVVPNRAQRWRQVLPGAIAAGALFEGFSLLFPLYFRLQHGFSTYGRTFGLFFLILFYAFVVGQIIVVGYCFALEREARGVAAAPATVPDRPAAAPPSSSSEPVRSEPARGERAPGG